MRNIFENTSQNSPETSRAPNHLRKILAVGAYPESCIYGGQCADSFHLTKMVNYLADCGLVKKTLEGVPEVDVRVMNYRDRQDFLEDSPECDILMICYVPGFGRGRDIETMKHLQEQFSTGVNGFELYDFRISEFHSVDRWCDAVKRSSPKIIWTIGSRREIGTHIFSEIPLDVIQKTKFLPGLGSEEGQYGIPAKWCGVAFDKMYADSIISADLPETPLLRELQKRRKQNGGIFNAVKISLQKNLDI